jgi:hypothetical protein
LIYEGIVVAPPGFPGWGELLDLFAAISDTQLGAPPVRKSSACSLRSGIAFFAGTVDRHFLPGVSLLRRSDAARIEAPFRFPGISQASIEKRLAWA